MLGAVDAGPPIKAKEHKLSPCRGNPLMKICGRGWLVIIAPAETKTHLRCYCKYNLSHLQKLSQAQMRKFRMGAETLLLLYVWADDCCSLTRCQTPNA